MGQTTKYLTLCKNVRRKCGISGNGPKTVIDQNGILEDVVDWVAESWLSIQRARDDWLFKWGTFQFTTTKGTAKYFTIIGDLREWGVNETGGPITAWLQSDGQDDEYELDYMPYQRFREQYMQGENAGRQDKVYNYTISPDNYLVLGYVPDDKYVINGQYFKDIQHLSNDDDIVALDDRYVDIIEWLAVSYFGMAYESAAKLNTATREYRELFSLLCREQLPVITSGAPLV